MTMWSPLNMYDYVKPLEANITAMENNSKISNNQKKLVEDYVKRLEANITSCANSLQNYSSAIAKDINIDKSQITPKNFDTTPAPAPGCETRYPKGSVTTLEDGKTKICYIEAGANCGRTVSKVKVK